MPENLEIQSIVIHRIEKTVGEKSKLHLRKEVLPIDPMSLGFMFEVNRAYEKRSARKYGIFDVNAAFYPFQTCLDGYLKGENEFVNFTHQAMELYKQKIDLRSLATGGYVIFAHYFYKDSGNFLVIALNNKIGYAIDDTTLSISKRINLDFDNIDLANKVDINLWNNQEENYLSFIKGKKNISEYFLEFIGCTTNISPREETTKLVNIVSDFLNSLGLNFEQKQEVKSRILSYCGEKLKKDEEIEIKAIANLINPEDPDSFYNYATDEERRLNDSFFVDNSPLKRLKTVAYRGRDFLISFSEEALINSITYDEEENTLTINNVPDALKQEILNRL